MAELAYRLDNIGQERKETWAFAHNLGFDLTVSALPVTLEPYGWHTEDFWLGDESTWLIMKNGVHKLVLTDSWSWLHDSLRVVGKALRKRKVELPDNADSVDYWLKRCEGDVEILTRALTVLMDWWDENGCGQLGDNGLIAAAGRLHVTRCGQSPSWSGRTKTVAILERSAIFGGQARGFLRRVRLGSLYE